MELLSIICFGIMGDSGAGTPYQMAQAYSIHGVLKFLTRLFFYNNIRISDTYIGLIFGVGRTSWQQYL